MEWQNQQVLERLPDIDLDRPSEQYWEPIQTDQHDNLAPWTEPDIDFEFDPPSELVQRTDLKGIRRHKESFLQRLSLSAEWNDPAVDTGLSVTRVTTSLTVAIPLGSLDNLLLVTPSFDLDLLNSSPAIDVPFELYDGGIGLLWKRQYNQQWGSIVSVTPSYTTDSHNSRNAIRIRGLGLVSYQWIPDELLFLFGIVYLDRNDYSILPGVGLIWTPNPDVKLEVLFPRPKFAYRVEFVPTVSEHWVYIGAQLNGRTWSVDRAGGVADELTLDEYRLVLGWERIVPGGGGMFAEIGWSFGRELEYEINPLQISFGDAVVFRAGISY